ncbi:hypothetical protein [Bacillus sp. FSL M8-0077]|uniref:hypothetical protein n=1 Tax=Bacillus sp. FSL M8-0077 TaxID=2954556 RepID=UPI00116A1C56
MKIEIMFNCYEKWDLCWLVQKVEVLEDVEQGRGKMMGWDWILLIAKHIGHTPTSMILDAG